MVTPNSDQVETRIVEQLLNYNRSHVSAHPIKIQFVNMYSGSVSLRWLDFSGEQVQYAVIPRGRNSRFDVRTFCTHPWVFYDTETQQRVSVQLAGRRVGIFEPWCALQLYKIRNLINQETFNKIARCQQQLRVFIVPNVYPVQPLRQLGLRAIAKILKSVEKVEQLEIPLQLQEELKNLLT